MIALNKEDLINDFKEADDGKPWTLDQIIDFIDDTDGIVNCRNCKYRQEAWAFLYCTLWEHGVKAEGYCSDGK